MPHTRDTNARVRISLNAVLCCAPGGCRKEMQTNSAALSALPTRWNNVKSSASPVVVSALDPGITALDRVLSATSSGQGSCGQVRWRAAPSGTPARACTHQPIGLCIP